MGFLSTRNGIIICIGLLSVPVVLLSYFILKNRVAGGVVYRFDDGQILYLLITVKHHEKWILPKGNLEVFESEATGALREVEEESGVKGNITFKLKGNPYLYRKSSKNWQKVYLYAVEYKSDAKLWMEYKSRDRVWVPFTLAISLVSPEFKEALIEVHQELMRLQSN